MIKCWLNYVIAFLKLTPYSGTRSPHRPSGILPSLTGQHKLALIHWFASHVPGWTWNYSAQTPTLGKANRRSARFLSREYSAPCRRFNVLFPSVVPPSPARHACSPVRLSRLHFLSLAYFSRGVSRRVAHRARPEMYIHFWRCSESTRWTRPVNVVDTNGNHGRHAVDRSLKKKKKKNAAESATRIARVLFRLEDACLVGILPLRFTIPVNDVQPRFSEPQNKFAPSQSISRVLEILLKIWVLE